MIEDVHLRLRGDSAVALKFLVGPVALLLLITVYPLIFALSTSLRSYWLFDPDRSAFVGLDNYIALFRTSLFGASVLRTIEFAVGSLVLELSLGYGLALLLHHDRLGFGVLRVLLVMPVLLTPAVVALIWSYMYDPNIGIIQFLASSLGLSVRPWRLFLRFLQSRIVWRLASFSSGYCIAAIEARTSR